MWAESAERLRAAGLEQADSDARRIVEEASGHEGAALAVHLDDPVTERQIAYHDDMLARRLAGEPLQYALGRWGFRHLDLAVDQRVLIPRPETEQVVEVGLPELDRLDIATRELHVVDLGTGSGAIALSVATERVRTQVWAVDIYPTRAWPSPGRTSSASVGRRRGCGCSRGAGSSRCPPSSAARSRS